MCIHLCLGVPIMHENTNVIKPQEQKQKNKILNVRDLNYLAHSSLCNTVPLHSVPSARLRSPRLRPENT